MNENIVDSGRREFNGEIIWLDTISGDEWTDGTYE